MEDVALEELGRALGGGMWYGTFINICDLNINLLLLFCFVLFFVFICDLK